LWANQEIRINMTKNMTRKGLAFGAGLAMLGASFVTLPAVAAVDDTAVSLTPSAGTQYSMVTDGVFDLKSTQSVAATAGSGDLKYLVTDTASISRFDYQADTTVVTDDVSALRGSTVSHNSGDGSITVAYDISGFLMTLTNGTDANVFAGYAVGDQIQVAGLASATSDAIATATFTSYIISNTADDAITFLAPVVAGHDDDTQDLVAENTSALTLTEVPIIAFNGARAAQNAVDIYTIQFDVSESLGIITNNNAANDAFTNTAVGDVFKMTGMNSASINAFTQFVIVTAETDEAITFRVTGMSAIATVDVVAEDLSAGTFENVTDSKSLEEYGSIAVGAFGGIVTALAVPTRTSTGSYVVDTGADADSTKSDLLRLVATAAGSVTVTAWIDENGDGVIDGTESSSSTRTVTFVTWANSGAAVAFATPVAGAEWDAYVTFNETINAAQIDATRLDAALGVLEAGVLETAVGGTTAAANAFTAATNSFVYKTADPRKGFWALAIAPAMEVADPATTSPDITFVAGYTYAAQIFLDGAAYGEIVYSNNLTSQVADLVGAVEATRGDNVRQTNATSIQVKSDYSGAVEFKALLTVADAKVAGDPTGAGAGRVAVPAGTEATFKVAEGAGDLDAKATVTAGGKTLVLNGKAITYTALTDANGYVTFSLVNNLGKVGDDLDVTITHSGRSVTSSVIWTDAVADDAVLQGETDVSISQKGTYSINYTAVDDFGAALTSADYRVLVSYNDAVGAVAKSTGVNLNASGKGTLTVTDKSTTNGAFNVTGTLQKLNTSAAFANYGNPEVVTTAVTVTSLITASAVTAVATVDSNAGTGAAIEPSAGFAVDGSLPNSATVPAYSTDEEFTIAGVVTNSANSFIKGASVTISAPGLLFNTGALNTSTVQKYTVGSITVMASNVGAYSVEVRSNLSGAQTVTVTSGTAVKTVVVTFDAPLEANATQLTVSTPASTEVGSSFQAVVSLKDVFGNGVQTTTAAVFTLTYAGKGMALTVPSDTGADGTVTFGVLVGANDKGTGTVTASYNGDASKTTTDDNITVVNTIQIGAAAVASSDLKVNVGTFSGKLVVYALNAAGSEVSYKIAGKWVTQVVTSDSLMRYDRMVGANGVTVLVDIYVDGVKKLSKSVVTK
jgi:hypothetical protein